MENAPWRLTFLLAAAFAPCVVSGAVYYVATQDPAASDTNPGTLARPFKTISNACAVARAGDTVYIREGVYREALIPQHSGTPRRPIVFSAYRNEVVMLKGSIVLDGFVQEGRLWVKRPWTHPFYYWDPDLRGISLAPFGASGRVEQLFVNEQPLQWVPTRADLKPGCFVWDNDPKGGKGELVIDPPPGADLATALIEKPEIHTLLCAKQGEETPKTQAWYRWTKRNQPPADPSASPTPEPPPFPQISDIHVKKLRFRHGAHLLNRCGVRLDGDRWLLEDCRVEYMNAIGVQVAGDDCVVRRCVINHNGQCGFNAHLSRNARFEDCVTMYNNRKLFALYWAGAGNKLIAQSEDTVVRGLITAFNYGSGLWRDWERGGALVENCLSFGNNPINAGFFDEVSRGCHYRNNVAFANGETSGNFYGAALTLSCSQNVLAEGNVLCGGCGGIAMGGGRGDPNGPDEDFARTANNLMRDNLIVEPGSFTLGVSGNAEHNSVLPANSNRFVNNTALVIHGAEQVICGNDTLSGPEEFNRKYAHASGNRLVKRLPDLNRANRARLNRALARILNALSRAEGGPDLRVRRVELKEIWQVGLQNGSFGYWLEADRRPMLVLYTPKPDTVQLLTASANAEVWDFPPLHPTRHTPLARSNMVASAEVTGPFALITGLDPQTVPLGEMLGVSVTAGGAPVRNVLHGLPMDVAIEVRNVLPTPATFTLNGTGLKEQTFELAAGALRTFPVAWRADAERPRLTYTLASPDVGTLSRTTLLQVSYPLAAPRLPRFHVGPAAAPNRTFGGQIVLDKDLYRWREVYDVRTGRTWEGPEDMTARLNVGWTPEGLAIRAVVTDDYVWANPQAPWDGDCVELFLDGRGPDHFGQSLYSPGCYQVFCVAPTNSPQWTPLIFKCPRGEKGISGRARTTPAGYEMDILISWSLFPDFKAIQGAMLGLDVAVDDADENLTRHTQMVWKGTGLNFQDASRWGRIVLDAPVEVDLGVVPQPGDVLVRTGSQKLALYRPSQGDRPLALIPLRIEGQYAGTFSGGACFDADGNLYFLDGPRNLRLHRIARGHSVSEVLTELPPPDYNVYQYGADLLSPAPGILWLLTSMLEGEGNLHVLKIAESGVETVGRVKAVSSGHTFTSALSPDRKIAAVSSGDGDPKNTLALLRTDTPDVLSRTGRESGRFEYIYGLAFVDVSPPFLAVAFNAFAPGGTSHIARVNFDAAGSFPNTTGSVHSLFAAPGRLGAMADEPAAGRILVAMQKGIYAIPMSTLATGNVTLEAFTRLLDAPEGARSIAIAPPLKEQP